MHMSSRPWNSFSAPCHYSYFAFVLVSTFSLFTFTRAVVKCLTFKMLSEDEFASTINESGIRLTTREAPTEGGNTCFYLRYLNIKYHIYNAMVCACFVSICIFRTLLYRLSNAALSTAEFVRVANTSTSPVNDKTTKSDGSN